jgi:HAD superfamily hydrolase (TIGR01549 family)
MTDHGRHPASGERDSDSVYHAAPNVELMASERRYEAVLFDMDGVLIQGPSTPAHVYADAADDVVDEVGLDVPADERSLLRKHGFDERMARCCRDAGIEPERFWELRERFASRRANERLADRARPPYPDTEALADLPAPLGLVSNNRHETATFVADELFSGRFEVAIGRDPTPEGFRRRKPDPHLLERALAELDVESALYVGDRGKDLEAARAAGIDGAFLRREHNSRMSFDEPPVLDLESLAELPDALE